MDLHVHASLSVQATAAADGLCIRDLLSPHRHGVSQIMPYSTSCPDLLVTSTPHLPSVSVVRVSPLSDDQSVPLTSRLDIKRLCLLPPPVMPQL